LESVRGDPDVEDVVPIVVQYIVLELGGRREFMLLVGYDPATGGGPWKLVDGGGDIGTDGLVLDQVTADRHSLEPGDEMDVLDKTLTIEGISGGTSSWMTGTMFVDFETGADILGTGGMAAFGLVDIAEGADPARVSSRLEEDTGLTVTPRPDVNENDIELYAAVFNGPLALMVGIAFLVGASLVGLTIHTATVERSKEYGALKAIGIGNRALYAIVLQQAGMASFFGLIAGVGMAFATKVALEAVAPQFLVAIGLDSIAQAVLVAVLMSAAASMLPTRTIASIDPAIAFRKGV
jgi:putative ABC transport system permease protein